MKLSPMRARASRPKPCMSQPDDILINRQE
jgi:hypothetical protein